MIQRSPYIELRLSLVTARTYRPIINRMSAARLILRENENKRERERERERVHAFLENETGAINSRGEKADLKALYCARPLASIFIFNRDFAD